MIAETMNARSQNSIADNHDTSAFRQIGLTEINMQQLISRKNTTDRI